MRQRVAVLVPILSSLIGIFSPAALADEPAKRSRLDLSYINSDAIGAIILHPRQVLTDQRLSMLPTEVLIEAGKEYLGVDPSEVEVAIGLVGLGGLAQGQPNLGAILRFKSPYDRKPILERMGSGVVEQKVDGKTYYKLANPSGVSFCVAMPNDRTLLVGVEGQVKEMLLAEGVDSGLTRLLAEVDTSKTAVAVLDFSTVRPLVLLALESLPPLPEEVAQLLQIPKLVKSVELSINLFPLSIEIALGANDPGGARRLKDLADKAMALAQRAFEERMNQIPGRDQSPTARAMARYLSRISRGIFSTIQVRVEGSKVRVDSGDMGSLLNAGLANGALIAFLLPAAQASRFAAQQTVARNNMKQIGLALHNHHDIYMSFPGRAIRSKDGKPLLSWRVAILPFLEEGTLYKEFHLDEPWDSPHNRQLLSKMPRVYSHALVPDKEKTVYLALDGPGTIFGGDKPADIRMIRDGTSNTILVVEANVDRAVPWTKPEDLPYNPATPLAGLGKLRGDGFQVLMADGTVRFFKKTLKLDTIRAYATMAGKEVIEE